MVSPSARMLKLVQAERQRVLETKRAGRLNWEVGSYRIEKSIELWNANKVVRSSRIEIGGLTSYKNY